jgi:hypothetical protein
VQVIEAPTASEEAGQLGAASVLSSDKDTPVSTLVPVFVTT